ncbi:MAG: MAPEG family protein [Polyangiales bacterium]
MTLFYWHIVLNLGLVTLLAMNISRLRMRERVGLGDGGKLALKKAIRPHANALEHVLPFSFMVFVAASLEVDQRYLLILVTAFFVSRLGHAASYLYSNDMARQLSASVTYLCELAALVSIVAILVKKI